MKVRIRCRGLFRTRGDRLVDFYNGVGLGYIVVVLSLSDVGDWFSI